MRFVKLVVTVHLLLAARAAIAQQPLPVSKGVYRLPFADGTSVTFSNDHTNHPTTLNRVDMSGQGNGPFTVVAAGAGWVRIIVENNDTFCPNACGNNNDCNGDGVTTATENQQAQTQACSGYAGASTFCCERQFEANGGNCPGAGTCQGGPNNYVWMEHPNGEWTKYTHMLRGTVGQGTDNNGNPGAGRFVGEFIGAGTPLGIEGDVGLASGPHVHFEVAVPMHVQLDPPAGVDPDSPPDTINEWFSGGFLVGDGITDDVDGDGSDDVIRQNRIPVFCQIGVAVDNDNNTANPCNDACDAADPDLSGVTIAPGTVFHDQTATTIGHPSGDLVIRAFSGAALRAGTRVTLSPGFHAELNSYFSASTGGCDTPGGTGE
jgi:hypothetical protein